MPDMGESSSGAKTTPPNPLLSTATEHRRAGRFRESEELCRRVLREQPDNADAIYELGLIALNVGKSELAAAYLARAGELSPQDAVLKHDQAEAWMKLGDFNQAAACYRRALALDPQRAESHAGLGLALLRQKQFDQGVQSLAKSLELGLDKPLVHQHLASALLQLNRFKEAEAAARKATTGTPNSAEGWQALGEAVGNQQRLDEAMECFRKAIGNRPDWPQPHYALGITLGRAGRAAEAVDSLKMALRLRPEFPEALSHLGTMLVNQRRVDEAIKTLREAVRLRPNHLDSHVELARALEVAQKPQEAADAFKAILKLSPNNQNVMFHMAALSGKDAPAVAPPALVTALFNRHADTFDQHLLEHLEYRAPQLLKDAIVEAKIGEQLDVLDLGCGTGLCGQLLRPLAKTLSGLDLSAGMIEKARERNVYDRLEVGDIVATLRNAREAYDLLVASDVLCYIGELSDTLAGAHQALRPGGHFAFTVEESQSPEWTLLPSRRYAHSAGYIRKVAGRHGFEVAHLASRVLRKEGGKDLFGLVVILHRPAKTPLMDTDAHG